MAARLMAGALAALALMMPSVPAHSRAPSAGLAATVGGFARNHDFSGTILITERKRTLYRRSFGLADRAFRIPAAMDTRYRVASITKLFTAVLILQLAQEGRLDLDSPFGSVLPDYPGSGADRITVHQLLNHTSGLAQWDRVGSYQEAFRDGVEQYQRPLGPAALLERCCSGKPAGEPGRTFDYNNADYFVLGRIVEHLTGSSFEDALAERILEPLGLRGTGMSRWDEITPRLAPTYFYRDDTKALIRDMPIYWENGWAAGGMYSTAADIAAFSEALFGGRLLRPEMLGRLLAPGLDDYGYGLWSYGFTRNGKTWRVAKRPGRIMGANAVLYRLIDSDTTIVILANTNRADLDVFAQRIADVLVR